MVRVVCSNMCPTEPTYVTTSYTMYFVHKSISACAKLLKYLKIKNLKRSVGITLAMLAKKVRKQGKRFSSGMREH